MRWLWTRRWASKDERWSLVPGLAIKEGGAGGRSSCCPSEVLVNDATRAIVAQHGPASEASKGSRCLGMR